MRAFKVAVPILSICCLALISCDATNSSSGNPSTIPAQNRVVIRAGDRTFASPQPAELKVTFGAVPILELGVSGAADNEVWSAIARLSREQATQGVVNIALSGDAIKEGAGNLFLRTAVDTLAMATSGEFSASISNGRIKGEARAVPEALTASVEGDIVISCWIPRGSSIDEKVGGSEDRSGSEVLVEDENLSSPACQPFKALR